MGSKDEMDDRRKTAAQKVKHDYSFGKRNEVWLKGVQRGFLSELVCAGGVSWVMIELVCAGGVSWVMIELVCAGGVRLFHVEGPKLGKLPCWQVFIDL